MALAELRERERACIDSLRHIMSPIRTQPTELLAQIFELAIDDETHIKDVFRISQVCSDWRKVAHATPRLWTRPICVDLERRSDGRGSLYAAGLDAWLARSAPLHFPISLRKRGDDEANICHLTLENILKNAPRVQSLGCENFFPLPIISRLAGCRLDSLEELEFGLGRDNCPTPPVFTMAPRLRKFSMTLHSENTPVIVPWAQLTNIKLDSDSPDIVLDILAQCTGLTQVSICASGWNLSTLSQITRHTVALRKLHTLSLHFGFPQYVAHFLDSLSAHALQSLRLNFRRMQGSMQSAAPLTVFLMQSPNLTQLEILCGPCALTTHESIEVLEQVPRLTHLTLGYSRYSYLDDELLDALSYKDDIEPLVPYLHSLVLDNIGEDGVSTDALERTVLYHLMGRPN
ncbi:hypothetical protein C8R45DRAFT_1079526 [Mycena sanguinolenta]|nr:hypothetical protein C8R45DRAFT_1079526 [Mycena sanguinolenta]